MADTADWEEKLDKMSVPQLRLQLIKYGLDTKGKKVILVARLVNHLTLHGGMVESDKEEEPTEEEELELLGEENGEVAGEGEQSEAKGEEEAAEAMDTEQVEEVTEETEEDDEKGDGEEEKEEKKEVEEKPKPKPDEYIFEEEDELYTKEEIAASEVPYRTLVQDMKDRIQEKRVCLYPVTPEDLAHPTLREIMKSSAQQSLHLRSAVSDTDCLQGYLELRMFGHIDLDETEKSLREWKEGISIQTGSKIDLAELAKENPLFSVPPPKRTICVTGIPENATESQLLELFTGFQAIISRDKDGKANGRGYVEFDDEEEALEAVEQGQTLTWGENKLHVFLMWHTPGRDPKTDTVLSSYDTVSKAQAAAQKRLDMMHKWEGHNIAFLEGKIDEIEAMENILLAEEEKREKLGLPAPKRWRHYSQQYMHNRANSVYSHLKRHLYLTIDCLREKLKTRQQRQRDRVENPDIHAKKVARKSEKWQEKRMSSYRGGMKRPYSSSGGGYWKGNDTRSGMRNYGRMGYESYEKRARMPTQGMGYGYASEQHMGLLSLIREHSWQGDTRQGGYGFRRPFHQ